MNEDLLKSLTFITEDLKEDLKGNLNVPCLSKLAVTTRTKADKNTKVFIIIMITVFVFLASALDKHNRVSSYSKFVNMGFYISIFLLQAESFLYIA